MKVWRKAKRSANYNCVEVAPGFDAVYLRDSKNPASSPIFEFTPDQWGALLSSIKRGELDG